MQMAQSIYSTMQMLRKTHIYLYLYSREKRRFVIVFIMSHDEVQEEIKKINDYLKRIAVFHNP